MIETRHEQHRAKKGEYWWARGRYAAAIEQQLRKLQRSKKEAKLPPISGAELRAFRRYTARQLAQAMTKVVMGCCLGNFLCNAAQMMEADRELVLNIHAVRTKLDAAPWNFDLENERTLLGERLQEVRKAQAFKSNGEEIRHLFCNAIDYDDVLAKIGERPPDKDGVCRDIHMTRHYVCRGCGRGKGPNGTDSHCGLTLPKMWIQMEGKERWYCGVNWKVLRKENPEEKRILDMMGAVWGPDMERWPNPGCGRRFAPWKRGAAWMITMHMSPQNATSDPDEGLMSFLATTPDAKIQDAFQQFRAVHYENLDLTESPQALFRAIQVARPLTGLVAQMRRAEWGGDGTVQNLYGRFPVGEWIRRQLPILSDPGWASM